MNRTQRLYKLTWIILLICTAGISLKATPSAGSVSSSVNELTVGKSLTVRASIQGEGGETILSGTLLIYSISPSGTTSVIKSFSLSNVPASGGYTYSTSWTSYEFGSWRFFAVLNGVYSSSGTPSSVDDSRTPYKTVVLTKGSFAHAKKVIVNNGSVGVPLPITAFVGDVDGDLKQVSFSVAASDVSGYTSWQPVHDFYTGKFWHEVSGEEATFTVYWVPPAKSENWNVIVTVCDWAHTDWSGAPDDLYDNAKEAIWVNDLDGTSAPTASGDGLVLEPNLFATSVKISVNAHDSDGNLKETRFYYGENHELIGTVAMSGYEDTATISWIPPEAGIYNIQVKVIDHAEMELNLNRNINIDPHTLEISNVNVLAGEKKDFGTIGNILSRENVAFDPSSGDSNYEYLVQNGGESILLAATKITLKPGVHLHEGSLFWAGIDSNMNGYSDVEEGTDSDGDGAWDLWEIDHGLNPNDASDMSSDYLVDSDGIQGFSLYDLNMALFAKELGLTVISVSE